MPNSVLRLVLSHQMPFSEWSFLIKCYSPIGPFAVLSTLTHSSGGLNAVAYKGVIRQLLAHPKEPNIFGVAGDDDLLKVVVVVIVVVVVVVI